MSRVQCEQCGNQFSLADESHSEGEPRAALSCERCGGAVRPAEEPLGEKDQAELEAPAPSARAATEDLTEVFSSRPDFDRVETAPSSSPISLAPTTDEGPATDPELRPTPSGPFTAAEDARPTDPALPAALSERDSSVPIESSDFISNDPAKKTLPTAPARAAAHQTLPEAANEDEAPHSETPSIASLVKHTALASKTDSVRSKEGLFERPQYDLRPPDIQVEETPTSQKVTQRSPRTDAPVAGSNRPQPATSRSQSRWAPLALLLLLGGGIFAVTWMLRAPSEQPPLSPATLSENENEPPASEAQVQEPAANTPASLPPPAVPETTEEADLRVPAEPALPRAAAAPRDVTAGANIGSGRSDSADASRAAAEAQPSEPPSADAAVATEPALEEFDVHAATVALDTAAADAGKCRKDDDPSGLAVVTITFAASGRVTTATVSGPPFAGTQTGGCIASALRKARVPAFAGDFMTLKKTVTIQ